MQGAYATGCMSGLYSRSLELLQPEESDPTVTGREHSQSVQESGSCSGVKLRHIEPRCASTIGSSSSCVMSLPRNCSFIMLNMHMPAATPPAGTCHTAGDVGKLLSMDLQDAKHGQKSDLRSGSSACSW